jgi:periplasmic protein TonB
LQSIVTGRDRQVAHILDAPGWRLTIAAVLALTVWSAFLTALTQALSSADSEPAPRPLDARLVILPKPPTPEPVSAPPSQPVQPLPSPSASHAHLVAQRPARPPAMPKETSSPSRAPVTPAAESSVRESALPPATNDATNRNPAPAAAAQPVASTANADAPARPIEQPLPDIPEDLREFAFKAVALARFTVHINGSVDVELVKPTANPRLNQLVLQTLRSWRFFPAMKNGQPVQSEQDIRIHLNIE